MKVVATILAVESRRRFAEKLRRQIATHMPVEMSCEVGRRSLQDAFDRSKLLLQFATLQNADWLLFLEDDQLLTDEFWEILPRLLNERSVDCWYLANRAIPIGQMGHRLGYRVNYIRVPVAGAHGLLMQTRFIPALLADNEMQPIDFWLWKHIVPISNTICQVLSPICAKHMGAESTLHYYEQQEQMRVHAV